MLALFRFKPLFSPLKDDRFLTNDCFLGGGVVQKSSPLIFGCIPLSSDDNLLSLFLVFPLIEKGVQICHTRPMKLFPFTQSPAKKPARRELTKEDVLLAQRIKQLRQERGLTQEELSDLLGMNTSYITQVEARQQGLSLPMVYRLAKVFHLSLQEFFSF